MNIPSSPRILWDDLGSYQFEVAEACGISPMVWWREISRCRPWGLPLPFATATAEATRSDATWAGAKWIHSGAPRGIDERVPSDPLVMMMWHFPIPKKWGAEKETNRESSKSQGSGGWREPKLVWDSGFLASYWSTLTMDAPSSS